MEQALKRHTVTPLWQSAIVKTALVESFKKLDPRHLAKNPVMFVVEVGSVVTTWFWIAGLRGGSGDVRLAPVAVLLGRAVQTANQGEAVPAPHDRAAIA